MCIGLTRLVEQFISQNLLSMLNIFELQLNSSSCHFQLLSIHVQNEYVWAFAICHFEQDRLQKRGTNKYCCVQDTH